jgi:GNAT superfamily N-acetyltransferase
MHWAFFDHSAPVAAARLTMHTRLDLVPNPEVFAAVLPPDLAGPIAVLTRLVVDQSHRGRGLSTALDHARIHAARSAGCRWVIGSTFAGQKRLAQMVGQGFRILGEAAPYASGPLKTVGESGEAGGGRKEIAFILPAA